MSRFPVPASEPSTSERWSSPEFERELRAWVESVVGPARLERVRLRPWSTVWRVDSERGAFWAKQNCPLCGFEAALLDVLARLVPDHVVAPEATDTERGLLLTADQGAVLGFEHVEIASWCRIVAQWASVQRELVSDVDRLADAGLTVLRPDACEDLLVERVEALHALPADDPMHLGSEALARIRAGREDLRRAVDVVGALGLPITLNHNDLHGGNIFDTGEALRFFDLGDAMLTEPMAVLLVPLEVLADLLGCEPDDARLRRVADAWVEVWSDVVPAARIREALPHALRLARLARHESWLRVTPPMTHGELADWGSAPREWLVALPDRPLLAGPGPAASPTGAVV